MEIRSWMESAGEHIAHVVLVSEGDVDGECFVSSNGDSFTMARGVDRITLTIPADLFRLLYA